MDNKEYISSGILELYASGLLNDNDAKEVEDIIRKHPEVQNEYEKIEKTIYLSASLYLQNPSSKVKTVVLDRIKDTKSDEVKISSLEDPVYKRSNNIYPYLIAASIAFLIVSLGTNFFLWNKLKDAKNEISLLNDQKKIMVQEFEIVSKKLSRTSEDMNIIKDRSYKMVDLKGLEKSPSSNVLAFWNPETKKVYVEIVNLPIPPSNKQYQLWALNNGKPVDAGVMDVDPSDTHLHEMKNIEDAQAFAITLEPKGGSANPTLDQMYVMGKL